jgi:hypothetical protein
MVRSRKQAPWALLTVLLAVGAAAATGGLWLGWHPNAVSNSGVVIAGLLGVYFVCLTWALLRYLRWRDQRRAVGTVRPTYSDEVDDTVYGMEAGGAYRVMQSFVDFHGNQFRRGEVLRFNERHFLPYHGGHTVSFDERSMYLQEEQNAVILANFSDYLLHIKH